MEFLFFLTAAGFAVFDQLECDPLPGLEYAAGAVRDFQRYAVGLDDPLRTKRLGRVYY